MRISDWSSDVCSSDLDGGVRHSAGSRWHGSSRSSSRGVTCGGFDLSAGAVVSLVNVVLATQMQDAISSQILFGVVALLIGGAVGAVNGFFVAFMRLQPIVVTLSTTFIVQGITLLVLEIGRAHV